MARHTTQARGSAAPAELDMPADALVEKPDSATSRDTCAPHDDSIHPIIAKLQAEEAAKLDVQGRWREGEHRLQMVAERTKDYAIVALDDDGVITDWNAGAEGIFGFTQREALGQPIDIIYVPEDREQGVAQEEMRIARSEGRIAQERCHMRKNGSVFLSSDVLTRLDQDGIVGFAKIARDLRDTIAPGHHRDLRTRAGRASRNLHTEQQRRDEFLAVISHELKQPLNLIYANAEMLARSPDARDRPAVARAADTIRRTVMSQAQIIDDLLDLSRLRTGKLAVVRSPMNWCEVVQRIADAMQGQAAARNVQLTVRIPQTPLAIDADAIRIEQIVWNLLSNALKFTPAGGHVELSLRATGQHFAMLEVKDSGKGISAEFLPYVFDIFEQGHRASIQGGGLGIGLSLVKQFTMLHGGQVRAYSNGEGQGARFTITLPLRKDSVVLPADSIERGTDTLSGLTLLFVDDDTETVEAFSALLEAEGASVIVATTGDEALRLVSAHEIDVVLSDLGLPGIDGFELLRRIKAQPRFAALPAVALSGYAGESESKRAREAGFAVHLNKPIILDSLVQTICTLLGRR